MHMGHKAVFLYIKIKIKFSVLADLVDMFLHIEYREVFFTSSRENIHNV
jgi:hypothetical protein